MSATENVKLRSGVMIPSHQAEKQDGYHGIRIYTPNNSVPSTLPSAGGNLDIDIQIGKRLKIMLEKY